MPCFQIGLYWLPSGFPIIPGNHVHALRGHFPLDRVGDSLDLGGDLLRYTAQFAQLLYLVV